MIRFLGKTPAAMSFESFPSRGASAARRAGYSLFDGTYYSDNRSNSRANTCNKPRLLEGMHLLDKRSTQALPVALMIHDNSSDRTALVPATHHSNFCPINFRCWTLGWADRSAVGVHRSARPFCQRCAPGLNWPGRASSAVTLKKLECSKQAYALYTLAWDNIIGFRSYCVGLRDRKRKLGARRRSDTVLVSTINDADQGSADVAFRTPLAPYEKSKSLGSGGSMVARLKLKGIDGRAPPGVEPAATQHGETYQIIAIVGLQRGIPSKRESSARVDYVPALCTHRPSLLPIEWSGEVFGSRRRGRFAAGDVVRSPLNLII
ncbi:hypothetical protein S83_059510 [Arachis hypogaea]